MAVLPTPVICRLLPPRTLRVTLVGEAAHDGLESPTCGRCVQGVENEQLLDLRRSRVVLKTVCRAKIHRATVTQADLNYMGSITIDRTLMKVSGIVPFEMLQITNLSTGTLWQTYAIAGDTGSGTICLNGPPARHFQIGDKVIILSLAQVTEEEWAVLRPRVVFVNERNQVTSVVEEDTVGWLNEEVGTHRDT